MFVAIEKMGANMMVSATILLSIALLGCKGANEPAGEKQDDAATNAAGEAYTGFSPAEGMGRAQDRAASVATKVRDDRI